MRFFFLIIVGICLLGLLLSFNFQINSVSGTFMAPSFQSGDKLLFKKYFLGSPSPSRADVVVYKKPDGSGITYIGRVIAMPLEEIRVENGNVYIKTDKPMKMTEEYIDKNVQTHATPEGEWVKLNEFQYLIVSDNRSDRTIDLKNQLVNKDQINGVLIHKL